MLIGLLFIIVILLGVIAFKIAPEIMWPLIVGAILCAIIIELGPFLFFGAMLAYENPAKIGEWSRNIVAIVVVLFLFIGSGWRFHDWLYNENKPKARTLRQWLRDEFRPLPPRIP